MPRATSFPNPKQLIPLAALLATLPLLLQGVSCGHDLGFHLQSWLDAAAQLRHGHYPVWAQTPAWNAGEPRFTFYPPLSWLCGALLTLLLPVAAAPASYIFLTLTAAGFTMHRFARTFAAPHAALLAAVLYLANPYMLFNAFERSAMAELLASVWIPLLLLAILRQRPTVRGIAIPLALLWLTNAPAAVMGSYTFALLAALRVAFAFRPTAASPSSQPRPAALALTSVCGAALGMALPAFYLVPAAYQRRFVQIAMAIIPNMRFQDNFLFTHTADAPHNDVNDTATYLTLTILLTASLTLCAVFFAYRRKLGSPSRSAGERTAAATPPGTIALTILTAVITLLLFSISTPLWLHLPEFAFLQFPWRLNTILSAIAASAMAMLLTQLPSMRWLTVVLALFIPLGLGYTGYRRYAQGCDVNARPAVMDAFFRTHHGVAPTDEYTPGNADNDLLRTDDPAYWLVPLSQPNTPAPNTVPTPNELHPGANTDDYVPPAAQTLSTPAPHHFTVHAGQPQALVMHLRDYPGWDVTCTNANRVSLHPPAHLQRDDGLLTIALPAAGDYTIDIAPHTGPDRVLGWILSALALLALLLLRDKPAPGSPPNETDALFTD